MATPGPLDPVLSASEVSQYIYCPRAWWLQRVCGCQATNLEQRAAGQRFHAQHGRQAQAAHFWHRLAWGLLALGGLALLAALLQLFSEAA